MGTLRFNDAVELSTRDYELHLTFRWISWKPPPPTMKNECETFLWIQTDMQLYWTLFPSVYCSFINPHKLKSNIVNVRESLHFQYIPPPNGLMLVLNGISENLYMIAFEWNQRVSFLPKSKENWWKFKPI